MWWEYAFSGRKRHPYTSGNTGRTRLIMPPYRGGPFVKGLRRVIRDVQIGSLLIQSDNQTGEPLLFHTSLPECVKSRQEAAKSTVLIMDAQISTGAAGIMAVRVLLDHGILGA